MDNLVAYQPDTPVPTVHQAALDALQTAPAGGEPASASIGRRVLGWLIDFGLVMVPAIALIVLALTAILHGLPGYVGAVAAEAGLSALLSLITGVGLSPGSIASAEWIGLAMPLLGAIVAMPMIQFAYHATFLMWRGRTVGNALTDTRIGAHASGGGTPVRGRHAVRRAMLTTVLEAGLVSVAWLAITLGQFSLGLLIWLGASVAFWLDVLPALGGRRRTIVDRLAGTVVVRTSLYADVAKRSAALAQQASSSAAAVLGKTTDAVAALDATSQAGAALDKTTDAVASAGRKGADLALSAARATGQLTSDVASVAGRLARESAEAVGSSTAVQRAKNSQAAQRAQALGAAGVEQTRQLSEQAADQAKQLAGRALQAWRQQRARREDPAGDGPPQLASRSEDPPAV